MGQMKNYRQLLKELPSNKVVFSFGQFQPPTAIHELHIKAVKKLAEEQKSDYVILASKDPKEELLSEDKKIHYMNLIFPNTHIQSTNASTIIEAAKELNRKYKNLIMITSSDLKEDYEKILNKKNKTEFFFETIEVIAAGDLNPDKNKLCESAKKGDYTKFKSGLPTVLREIDSRRLMNDIRSGFGLDSIKEEIKLVKDDLREKYFRGEIFNLGDIVECNDQQYEIVKRGSNHLLLKEESGELVSKWIQDVKESAPWENPNPKKTHRHLTPEQEAKAKARAKQMNRPYPNWIDNAWALKEGVIQQSGTDDLDPPTIDTKSNYNIAKDVLRMKDFKKLSKMNQGGFKEESVEDEKILNGMDRQPDVGHTMGGHTDNHRRRKVNYRVESVEQESIEELSNDLLTKYKKAAGENASAADKTGNFEKGNKRFKGIKNATFKQFANDLKKHNQVNEDNSHYEEAEEHLSKANDADAKGDKLAFHHHMADHHDSMSQWHDSKGRSAAADKHAEKADYHSDKYTEHARGVKENTDLEEAKKKKEKKRDDFKPTATEVKMSNDDHQLGDTNAHGFDAFFNEDNMSDTDIDLLINTMTDDDLFEAYEDSELALIDEETGEELDTLDDNPSSQINEVLSRAERIRAKIRFAKTKSKRQNKAKLALRRSSSSETINKRARRLAVTLFKKRMLRGRPMSSVGVAEKERMEKTIQKRKAVLNRVAMKLTSRVRQIEKSRLHHQKFTKGGDGMNQV
jgi:hypothetical protein